MKNIIVVTGGAGFVGSNLIDFFLKKTKFKIISIDNYSSGSKDNHVQNNRVKYYESNTLKIKNILNNKIKKIHTIFHFGEYSRIFQSFKDFNKCFEYNSIATKAVFKFCLENKIKLVYSATSASLGNKGEDKNLSPYAFTKAKNLELLENLKKWFNFKFEIIYFYNVYGPKQISKGSMATVVGIFENHYINKKKLPVVSPGTQSRRFTHIDDTVQACYKAWKINKNCHYSISSKKSYTILELAKLFKSKIKFLPPRKGERFSSALNKINLNNKIIKIYGKIDIKNYVKSFLENNKI